MPPGIDDLSEALLAAENAGNYEQAAGIAKQLRAARAWERGARRAQLGEDLISNESGANLYLAGLNRRAREIATLGTNERAGPEADQLLSESGAGAAGGFTADMMSMFPLVKGAQMMGKGVSALSPWAARNPAITSIGTNALTAGGFEGATTPGDFSTRAAAARNAALYAGAGDLGTRALGFAAGGPLRTTKAATPDAQALLDSGVPLPFWKATDNGFIRNMAERAKAMPFARMMILPAEEKAMEAWNTNLAKAATPPRPVLDEAGNILRWKSEPVTKTGSEGLRDLRKRYDEAYDALYKGRVIPVDVPFQTDVNEVLRQTRNYLPGAAQEVEGLARQVRDILKPADMTRQGDKLIQGHAGVDHETLKHALNVVDDAVGEAWRAGQGRKAEALQGIKDALLDMRSRGLPPEVQAQVGDVNSAYRNFKILERAGSSVAAQNKGMVSPNQLLTSMRALDRSPNKSAFARENVQGQSDALAASRVLGSTLPEVGPGTAEKLIFHTAALSPAYWATDLLATGGLAALMSPQGQRMLLGQYGFQRPLSNAIKSASPYVAQGAGVLAP